MTAEGVEVILILLVALFALGLLSFAQLRLVFEQHVRFLLVHGEGEDIPMLLFLPVFLDIYSLRVIESLVRLAADMIVCGVETAVAVIVEIEAHIVFSRVEIGESGEVVIDRRTAGDLVGALEEFDKSRHAGGQSADNDFERGIVVEFFDFEAALGRGGVQSVDAGEGNGVDTESQFLTVVGFEVDLEQSRVEGVSGGRSAERVWLPESVLLDFEMETRGVDRCERGGGAEQDRGADLEG